MVSSPVLISHKKKFIFTKTFKTAGTSVESYFEQYCMPNGEWIQLHEREEYVSKTGIIGRRSSNKTGAKWYNHMAASKIHQLVGDKVWDEYFKFTVVRNPFDKVISQFYFQYKNEIDKQIKQDKWWNKYKEVKLFRVWLENNNVHVDRNKYLINNAVCVDYFIRYEKLNEGIEDVCNTLNLSFEPSRIASFKKGGRNIKINVADYYDKKSYLKVKDAFSWEMNYFGYDLF